MPRIGSDDCIEDGGGGDGAAGGFGVAVSRGGSPADGRGGDADGLFGARGFAVGGFGRLMFSGGRGGGLLVVGGAALSAAASTGLSTVFLTGSSRAAFEFDDDLNFGGLLSVAADDGSFGGLPAAGVLFSGSGGGTFGFSEDFVSAFAEERCGAAAS